MQLGKINIKILCHDNNVEKSPGIWHNQERFNF